MTGEELRSGLRRLGFITLGLMATSFVISVMLVVLGSPLRAAVAAGTGTVGVLMVLSGLGAFAKASPWRQARSAPPAAAELPVSRRDTEYLALGLFGYGIAFSNCALVLG
jgi:hypothetical protein